MRLVVVSLMDKNYNKPRIFSERLNITKSQVSSLDNIILYFHSKDSLEEAELF